jgi:lipoprotein-anchoring transpeptidase ErfK/SrfK
MKSMDPKLIEAREHVAQARDALRRGDKETARDLAEKAVLLVPDLEDAWLVLVAADSNPEDALAYANKALELNPQSTRAHKAVAWATAQLQKMPAAPIAAPQPVAEMKSQRFEEAVPAMTLTGPGVMSEAPILRPVRPEAKKNAAPAEKKSNRTLLYAGIFLGLLLCIAVGVAGWWAINHTALASLIHVQNVIPTQEVLWAQVDLPKPGVKPINVSVFAPQPTSAVMSTPVAAKPKSTLALTLIAPTETPAPTDAPTTTPEATETPGVMAMEVVADTPTSAYVPPTAGAPAPAVIAKVGKGGTRWIDVNLSTQSVYAYEGDTVVNSFIVSTGTWIHPTVTGQFKIYIKLVSGNMSGPGYFLPNVPYIMYFYKSYGLHGTYWHSNFGTPMSHGCVNLRTSDAQWLYNWASLGTVVNVHY